MNLEQFDLFRRNAAYTGIIFYHSGAFTPPIISAAAESLKSRLQDSGATSKISRRLFSTFIEMAQNIYHYAAQPEAGKPDPATIAITQAGEEYFVFCLNRVAVAQAEALSERLETLTKMSLDEIKEAYRRQLKNELHPEENPDSKGAGLGWLTIARDAKEPLEFTFTIDPDYPQEYRFFLAKVAI